MLERSSLYRQLFCKLGNQPVHWYICKLDCHNSSPVFYYDFCNNGLFAHSQYFEISVVQEIKKYGLLRTIGTTEKQIKRIVYKQAFWLSIIGISIGLILGYIVGILMLPWILNFMKGEYHNLSVNLSFNPIILSLPGYLVRLLFG